MGNESHDYRPSRRGSEKRLHGRRFIRLQLRGAGTTRFSRTQPTARRGADARQALDQLGEGEEAVAAKVLDERVPVRRTSPSATGQAAPAQEGVRLVGCRAASASGH